MTLEIINSLGGYLETLYDLNHKLIKLCGVDILYPFDKAILDIIQDIPRIIPYKGENIYLDDKDGLLEYQDDIPYLKSDYEQILFENYDFLKKIKKIRNKYAHKLHVVQPISSASNPGSPFSYTFKIEDKKKDVKDKNDKDKDKDKNITLTSDSLIKLMKALNNLFSKIVFDIRRFADDKNEIKNHLYYIRITRFDFADFNKIYDDNLLTIIGQIMKNF